MNSKGHSDNSAVPTVLHPTLFLAMMLARNGDFPVKYLDGFQRLVDDLLQGPEADFSELQRADIQRTIQNIIDVARDKAGLND